MTSLHPGNLDQPEETRSFENGRFDVVHLGDVTVGRSTFEPGWKWSDSVKPVVGGDSCQQRHLGYAVSGRLHIVADDGEETEIGPGQVYVIMPGHDGWVVGDEAFVGYEFDSASTFAK